MLKGFTRSSTSPQLCSLYFKGLVGVDSLAGFGVAICGHRDDLLFQLNGPIHGSDITVLEAELIALKQGLTEAAGLGIDHISIYCDYYPVYKLISFSGRFVTEENKIALLIDDVKRITEGFKSSVPIFIAGNSIRYAYELARATLVSKIRIYGDPPCYVKLAKKSTCPICFDDDLEAEEMFYVGKCCHLFCSACMKRHIEVQLLEGSVPRCPHYGCKSNLTLGSCAHLLSPKLREMWERKIREDSIPVWVRVYCPNPTCSILMSKTEISKWTREAEVRRCCCIKCGEPLCINCRVPWHNNLSCNEYKRLHPNPTEK
ncbi:unnamed protein product [Arabidopsis lyrata]|uniref:uncharacterized protein LOC9313480 n=1 Tax=Arabidopsis lyrata subsp. lyrata TaxID=81972 RepID=UPI000A29BDB3|nr:uncharacterized protein LOC9313480 [Arabidopsis lyrata subsp. lyrata]CAH8267527.1 unnamed protein product [Arabidopsis lyrata]|eukprot:XP_020881732.1 uncharacterized protein LOC9313480 [Arabidopsis lyrata subsp. lyrata]